MPVEHWDETAAKVEGILDSVTRDTSKQDLIRQLRAAISTTRTVQVSVVMRGTVTFEHQTTSRKRTLTTIGSFTTSLLIMTK